MIRKLLETALLEYHTKPQWVEDGGMGDCRSWTIIVGQHVGNILWSEEEQFGAFIWENETDESGHEKGYTELGDFDSLELAKDAVSTAFRSLGAYL